MVSTKKLVDTMLLQTDYPINVGRMDAYVFSILEASGPVVLRMLGRERPGSQNTGKAIIRDQTPQRTAPHPARHVFWDDSKLLNRR